MVWRTFLVGEATLKGTIGFEFSPWIEFFGDILRQNKELGHGNRLKPLLFGGQIT